MFAILVYDVNKKRDRKVFNACGRYLCHVQGSVWEGNISEARLKDLKNALYKIINPVEDSVRIYIIPSQGMASIDELGNNVIQDYII